MNDPVTPSRRPSAAYRYLFVGLLGLVIGLIATVMVSRAIQARQDPFPDSLMHVMNRQVELLQAAQGAGVRRGLGPGHAQPCSAWPVQAAAASTASIEAGTSCTRTAQAPCAALRAVTAAVAWSRSAGAGSCRAPPGR